MISLHPIQRVRMWRGRLARAGPGLRLSRAERRPREPQEVEAPTPDVVRQYSTSSKVGAIIGILVGYHGLLGWAFHLDALRSPGPTYIPISIASAGCALLCGIGITLLQPLPFGPRAETRRRAAVAAATLSLLLSIVTLATLARRSPGGRLLSATPPLPAGISTMSAVAFLLVGAALFLDAAKSVYRLADAVCLAPAVIALLALSGYIYGASPFSWQMPLYSAIAVLALSWGLLSLRADQGFMGKITSNSIGGTMARQLIPAALIIPIVLGWLQRVGMRSGYFSSTPGLALLSITNILAFVAVVWWGVDTLYRMDTKRKRAERVLEETAAKLKRSNSDLEDFAYVASHDLKEPLRAITGSIQVLERRFREQLGADADQMIRHTVEGASRMQALIDDLLTYSRLTTREDPIEPVSSKEIVLEALQNLEGAIKESAAVVTVAELPPVRAARTQLLQVFQNLVGNALKYRSDRTPKIHVSAEEKDAEWVFSVRDNGIGIAPQYVGRIFRIFQRLHTREQYAGTGIGLAICKKIVERHGGRIWVESELEEGSTFFFALPK